jgi:site-specific DNA recombinase
MTSTAYGYVRVSSIGQVKGYGPQRQREDIEAFAAANDYEVAQFFEDAYTGGEADRPQFVAMLLAMIGNGVKTVIVESLDRFARDLLIQSTLLAKLTSEGLTLIAANTGEDITAAIEDDPMRKAMVQIQGVFAELDKTLLIRKLKRGRDSMKEETGRCEGQKPFGYYDGESEVLARIKQLCRKPRGEEHRTFASIATILNREAMPTRTGKPWYRGTVQKICRLNGWR